MNAVLEPLVPAKARRWLRLTFGWQWLRGDYATWAQARAASRGYDDKAVLDRVIAAARAARAGVVAWDRDGVTFPEPSLHLPLMTALTRIAAAESRIDLVDFGGGPGSTWWQHRAALEGTPVRWRVVEQPALAEIGRREFAGDGLEFYSSLVDACADGSPQVILLSSVLAYVANPHTLLYEVLGHRFPHIIIDRTGFTLRGRDRLTVQHVPPSIGAASYPCWLFDRATLLDPLAADYTLINEWRLDELDGRHGYHGFHFQRRGAER